MRPFLRAWLPAILWAAVIFYFSTDGFSSSATSRYIGPLINWIMPNLRLEYEQFVNFIIRKLAHLTEYFIFALFLYRGFGTGQEDTEGNLRTVWLTLAAIFVYACSDELHQSFVPSRTANFHDSLIDFFGGSCGILWTYCYNLRTKNNVPLLKF